MPLWLQSGQLLPTAALQMNRATPNLTLVAESENAAAADAAILREIAVHLAGLRFGSLEIVVHEGRVTQIERRERLRFGVDRKTRL